MSQSKYLHIGDMARFVMVALSAIFFMQVIWIYSDTLFWRDDIVFDKRGYALGVDFVNSWMMGHLLLHDPQPARFYVMEEYYSQLQAMFGTEYSQQLWSYPPHYALLMIPFGAMAYMVALAVFMAMNLAAFSMSIWRLVGVGWKQLAVAVLVSPAAICGFLSGQLALALTALQCWIFLLLDRRPILAGALLGLLSIKPQLGIAYPCFLLATQRWKVLVSATLTTLLLVAFSAAILGVDMWSAYLWQGVPAQHHFMMEHTPLWTQKLMPTWFMDMKNAGFSYDAALAGQWVLAALVASLFFTRRFRALESASQMLVVSAAGLLMTPYLMPYDTLFFTCSLLYAAQRRQIDVWFGLLMVAGYVFPALFWGASTLGIAGASLLPLLVILHAMWGKKLAPRSA